MRTVDILVTALFSPVAVATIGLADLYARFPLWIGLGMGSGAIALSSQDTGSGADANRDEAVSQALTVGALVGIPFAVFGVIFGEAAIAFVGAPADVARLGGQYLAIVLATGPARQVGIIAARALQGTGDTRTPMYVNIVANGLNILGSTTLGLGCSGRRSSRSSASGSRRRPRTCSRRRCWSARSRRTGPASTSCDRATPSSRNSSSR